MQRCSIAQRYIDAVNGKNVAAILALFAADAVVCDPVGQLHRKFHGYEQLRDFYEGVVKRADLRLTGPIRGGWGDTIAAEVLARIPGFEIDVITLTTFDSAGKISKYCAYWGIANKRSVPSS